MEHGSSNRQENILIRPLKKEDLPAVIKIHLDEFGSQSGLRFLEKAYYPTFFLPRSSGFGFVGVYKGQIAGFCLGTLDTSAFHRTLLCSQLLECVIAAVRMVFLGRKIWSQMSYSFRHLYDSPINTSGGRIFFTVVHKAFHKRGIASRLITEALNRCRSQGLKQCWSRALKSNTASYRLLTGLGFRVHQEMSEHDKYRFIFYHNLESNQHP
jgi:ribosomal protein S18 acetylase RimI-like enzyme